jgi:aminoglycoside 2'-N-acetyltransferase I
VRPATAALFLATSSVQWWMMGATVDLQTHTRSLAHPKAPRLRTTGDVTPAEGVAIRALLDAAFAGNFSDDDWAHARGGLHATIEAGGTIVAHAAVVPRTLAAGAQIVRAGYVEAVAVRPDHQRLGFGTAVLRAIDDAIVRQFELGVLSTGEWHFYERLGWERWRGETWVRHPDGRRERTHDDDDALMILRTPLSPDIHLTWPFTCESRAGDPW